MRVVLDTNVLISAFLFEKRLGKIVKLIERGTITPCFIMYTFQEFQNVLGYEKFKPLLKAAHTITDEIVESIQGKSLILDNPENIPSATSDIPDNYILAAAQLAEAAYIVTGDKQLLALHEFKNIPIVSPQKFIKQLTGALNS